MEEQNKQAPRPEKADPSDVEKNKGMAILAYIIFFIPILAAKDSKFAMYHANQGLILFLAWVAVSIVGTVVPFIGWFIIWPLGSLFLIVVWVMGLINASKGEMKPLPLIGGFKIL